MTKEADFFRNSSYIFSLNGVFLEELYDKYLNDPDAVSPQWREFFSSISKDDIKEEILKSPSWHPYKKKILNISRVDDRDQNSLQSITSSDTKNFLLKADINNLVDAYRKKGHFLASIDPLNLEKIPAREDLGLDLKAFALESSNEAKSVLDRIDKIYCDKIGYEFNHLDDAEQIDWLQKRIENFNFDAEISDSNQKEALDTLLKIETFEQFLQSRFPGTKRFSIEGGEASIIAARKAIRVAVSEGVQEVILGMPHRGRLSMLTKILNKPYYSMLSEFQGSFAHPEDLDVSGDVKYHLGISNDIVLPEGKVHISLVPNPSHLEAVNSVVAGKVRAKQDIIGDKNRKKVMGLLLHGDAAFAGQGVVMESLMLDDVPGYNTGGTLHIVINNQVGFTADAKDARSGRYPTEIAKIIKAPIFHVNGNSIKDVLKASKIATEFRNRFGKDTVLDIVCYRLYGHNEVDEPRFTQPVMYKIIENLKTPGKIYCDNLTKTRVVQDDYYDKFKAQFKGELTEELEKAKIFKQDKADWLGNHWSKIKRYTKSQGRDYNTGLEGDLLKTIVSKATTIPSTITAHKIVQKGYENRRNTVVSEKNIDWATAELLAFGSLLIEGTNIRFSGQDSKRGTFSHRHSVVIDQRNQEEYIPLNHIKKNQAKLEIVDSFLSEYGVMGFEYGYSTVSPDNLVIWEAQFGDFSNGAQIIIDQFISSAEEKWLRMSAIVLLLPHGYEGQGPEHSSARLERYLQLCAKFNLQVVNCSTPANYFHVLRRQIHRNYRKPLVVMTPKSLLRHKKAVSNLEEFTEKSNFEPVIVTNHFGGSKIDKIIICSGKVYYDLLEALEKKEKKNIVIFRIEQFYPFPKDALTQEISKFAKVKKIIYCQEEPNNMGAWFFIKPRLKEVLKDLKITSEIEYVGRAESASPAAGYSKTHNIEQDKFVSEAIN